MGFDHIRKLQSGIAASAQTQNGFSLHIFLRMLVPRPTQLKLLGPHLKNCFSSFKILKFFQTHLAIGHLIFPNLLWNYCMITPTTLYFNISALRSTTHLHGIISSLCFHKDFPRATLFGDFIQTWSGISPSQAKVFVFHNSFKVEFQTYAKTAKLSLSSLLDNKESICEKNAMALW